MRVETYRFFPIKDADCCQHPEHTMHHNAFYVPKGHYYRHICPECGETYTIYSDEFYNARDRRLGI